MGTPELDAIADAFRVGTRLERVEPLGRGHIHATFTAHWSGPEGPLRTVLQRVNTRIFRDADALEENLSRVTAHLARRLAERAAPEAERRCLRPIPSIGGRLHHRDREGELWRCLHFVEGTRSVDALESAEQAFAAARAFGEFAQQLADLPGPPLRETIPHFHAAEARLAALAAAAAADPVGRVRGCAAEIQAIGARAREVEARLAERGAARLPRRTAHHDCKLNNLLLDAASGEPLCVVDLDTVMPGTLLSDFGELVRTAASSAAEDEPDTSRIAFDLEIFDALARGYLSGTGALLGPGERSALALAGPRLTLMNAVRFLTDHLEGDTYFPARREQHNLERARAQWQLAERMLERLPAAEERVAAAAGPEPAREA